MNPLIRAAASSDAAAIGHIYREASIAALGELANQAAIAEAAKGRHAMWSPLTRTEPEYLCAVLDDGDVRGFVSVGPSAPSADTAHLFALYVDPSAWNKGLGSRLHDHAIDHLRALNKRSAELYVQVENARARTFYERRGWASTGEVANNDRGAFVKYTTTL